MKCLQCNKSIESFCLHTLKYWERVWVRVPRYYYYLFRRIKKSNVLALAAAWILNIWLVWLRDHDTKTHWTKETRQIQGHMYSLHSRKFRIKIVMFLGTIVTCYLNQYCNITLYHSRPFEKRLKTFENVVYRFIARDKNFNKKKKTHTNIDFDYELQKVRIESEFSHWKESFTPGEEWPSKWSVYGNSRKSNSHYIVCVCRPTYCLVIDELPNVKSKFLFSNRKEIIRNWVKSRESFYGIR